MTTVHVPVLPQEIVDGLAVEPGDVIVDGTLGGGGHTELLAKAVGPGGLVIGVDRDPGAVERAEVRLAGLPVRLFCSNFADLPELLAQQGIASVKGVVLDLGLSSDQLADDERGFSYDSEGLLDLRFDMTRGRPAYKLLQQLSERHLADLIYKWGEERFSRRIARVIVADRGKTPIETASQLSAMLRRVVPRSKNHSIDPATRTFQALRIAVNDELKWVEVALRRLPEILSIGGRIGVISFHSLEDRIAKQTFRDLDDLRVLTKKPIRASDEELANNPRSRSAKLRFAERIQA